MKFLIINFNIRMQPRPVCKQIHVILIKLKYERITTASAIISNAKPFGHL